MQTRHSSCTTILVGKKASIDGSVMAGRAFATDVPENVVAFVSAQLIRDDSCSKDPSSVQCGWCYIREVASIRVTIPCQEVHV